MVLLFLREYMKTIINNYEIETNEQCVINVDEYNHQSIFNFLFKENKNRHIQIRFSFPAIDIVGYWTPHCGMVRDLKSDWWPGFDTMMSISAPIISFYNNDSQNVRTIALSETSQKVNNRFGVREETGEIICVITIDLIDDLFKDGYSLSIYQNSKREIYWNVLNKVVSFWELKENYQSLNSPTFAYAPLYSFWYSYHQNVSAEIIEKECEEIVKFGFKTIIVDDGWQTDDNHRGYAYTGDWIPSENKFPNMKEHVLKIQSMGLKYMLWFSVPFVGIYSKSYQTFKDKLLYFDCNAQAGVLDIRYKEVRDYLKSIYIHAIKDWGIDGLKLDFIDEFYLRKDSPAFNDKMDIADVQLALATLLKETKDALKKYKPDLLIEFRQKYIGPEIRQYGNMLRVTDCPDSSLANRVGTIDLRLLSHHTAVHSDMLMWNKNDKIENIALQILSCLFSTIQISISLINLREDVSKTLRFYLDFMSSHIDLLQHSQIEPLQPQNLYPYVSVKNKNLKQECMVSYVENVYLTLENREKQFYYFNGGPSVKLVIKRTDKKYKCISKNCMGEIIHTIYLQKEYNEIEMPQCGLLECIEYE